MAVLRMCILHRLHPYVVRGVGFRTELVCDEVSSCSSSLSLFDGGGVPLPAHIIHTLATLESLIWAPEHVFCHFSCSFDESVLCTACQEISCRMHVLSGC